MSIGKYLEKTKMHPAEKLTNPMCLEFGVTTSEQLDIFIDNHLPDFRLVNGIFRCSLSPFSTYRDIQGPLGRRTAHRLKFLPFPYPR